MCSKSEFVRNGILTSEDVQECFDFAYGMTFGGQGEHRDHRSGGRARRLNGEVFANTLQGKMAEFALYNYMARVGEMTLDSPDMEMMELSLWDSFDMEVAGRKISVKSTKRRGNLLLLESKDWDREGRYIPNIQSGSCTYDYFVLVRIDPDAEGLLRERGLLHADSASRDELWGAVGQERWRANLAGYITGEELVEDVIGPGMVLRQGSRLNGSTVMDADNYYVQAGDMHSIEELVAELRSTQ